LILLAAMIHLDVGQSIGSGEVISADPLTWRISKKLQFGVLHHI
jgi:hypothetical protein